jgi:hypothetical protein
MYSVVLNVPVLRTSAIPETQLRLHNFIAVRSPPDPSFFTYPASVALTDLQSPLLNCNIGKLVRIPFTLVKSCNEKLQKVWSKSARSEGVIEMAETSRREG